MHDTMNPEPHTPPSVATTPPPLPQDRPKPKTHTWIIWVIAAAVVVVIGFVGITASVMIPTVSKVRQTARRTVDASDVRQIVQASLIYASEHNGRLPAVTLPSADGSTSSAEPATIHGVAVALARDGGLNESSVWFSASDRATAGAPAEAIAAPIVHSDGTLNAAFMREHSLAWDFVTGLGVNHPSTTPIAWTRGLRRDGTWDPKNGVYGGDGGHVAFLGGNVSFFKNLSEFPLVAPDGKTTTTDIVKTLPPGTRVVGAGPGTLHGAQGGSR